MLCSVWPSWLLSLAFHPLNSNLRRHLNNEKRWILHERK